MWTMILRGSSSLSIDDPGRGLGSRPLTARTVMSRSTAGPSLGAIHARRGLASAAANDNDESESAVASSATGGGGPQDEAARRRLEALKRFGVSGQQDPQGKPVVRSAAAKDGACVPACMCACL